MSAISFLSPSKLKSYLRVNKKIYLITLLVVVLGMVAGVYLNLGGYIDDIIFTATELDLSEIIVGEASGISLFFENFWSLLLPSVIIFVMYLSPYTKFLAYVYLGYQGILLGASMASVIGETGVAGVLNSLVLILPMNLMNFFVLMSVLVVSARCLMVRRSQHLTLFYSVKVFFTKFMVCLLGMVVCSLVYGFIYPLLLKTAVVVNV